MKAVIDLIKEDYIRCLLENGETITFHLSEFNNEEIKLGDSVNIKISLNKSE